MTTGTDINQVERHRLVEDQLYQRISRAVLLHYLTTEYPATVHDIASIVGFSTERIREVLHDAGGTVPGIVVFLKEGYVPTRGELREECRRLARELDRLKGGGK